jgi:TP901 family phage tail tape measure protein
MGMQTLNQIIGSLKKMATDLAAMDDIYADVRKYTGMTLEEVKALNEEFKKLDTRTAREQLNKLAGDAGRLGIQSKEKILEFVDAADKINVALGEDLGEDAVKNIGKMAEMFGETDRLGLRGAMLATGSAINFLGQNSSAAEPYLMEFTARLSGTANQAKMTQAQILGYASVLDQNMQQVEMSATAMQNLIMKMMQNPAKFAKMAGIEVGKFANMLESDANGALLTFIETLNKKGGLTQLAPMFKEMGLDGVRASGVISVLAKDINKVREEQEKANKAYQEGTSVTDEYGIKNNTLQAQLEKAKKKFQDMKLELGEKLYPVLLGLTKTSTGLIKIIFSISSFISENKGLVIALASAWVAYLAIMVKGKVATLAMGVATKANTVLMGLQKVAVLASSAAYNTMTGNATRAAAAQKMLKIAMASTPWGAILAAVTAIAVGIYKLATRQSEAEKAIKSFNSEAAKQEAEAMSLFSALKKTTK